MILAVEEIVRSLSGSWALLNRRAEGAARFDVDEQAFWRSFRAPLLAAPVFVIWLAADRAATNLPGEGGTLFERTDALAHTSFDFMALWLTLPLLSIALADVLRLRAQLAPFIIICNWSSVLAAAMLAVPALLLAIGWATPALAALFAVAAALLIMQMRWYAARITLGVTAGAAALLATGDALIGVGLLRLFV
ncbi:MAG: hypothetical protein JWN07_2693 [Hyphomicrobiales bacterium]|nr:hypothetical protein [Hyphomicrobiales bacterium]